jgi:hypothetical protein
MRFQALVFALAIAFAYRHARGLIGLRQYG